MHTTSTALSVTRNAVAPLIAVLLLLAGCARDVVLKPATTSFVADTRIAMQDVSQRYDNAITEVNDVSASFLARNPECGLNVLVRLRTEEADRFLRSPEAAALEKRLAAQEGRAVRPVRPSTSECLSAHERQLVEEWATAKGMDYRNLAPQRRLLLLSRSHFHAQLGLVERISEYIAALAAAADAPELTTPDKIKSIAKAVRAIGSGVVTVKQTVGPGSDPSLAALFADNGPVASFGQQAQGLAGRIEEIARQAHDVRTLRAAVTGPEGQAVRATLKTLAVDADRWSCITFMARRGRLMSEAEFLSGQMERMALDQRMRVTRAYLAALADAPELRCGTMAEGAAASPVAQMLEALVLAHDELERIARGDLTPEQRRLEAAATLQRLGAVFRAIGSTAMVLL